MGDVKEHSSAGALLQEKTGATVESIVREGVAEVLKAASVATARLTHLDSHVVPFQPACARLLRLAGEALLRAAGPREGTAGAGGVPLNAHGVTGADVVSGVLYQKYNVRREDGRDCPGGDKYGAEYFVLDITHDPFAGAALRAYADAVEVKDSALAAALREFWPVTET